jgi:hypothetical protein
MTTTQQDTRAMVLAYIKINRAQPAPVIAHALSLDTADVRVALADIHATDLDVIERDGMIVYTGDPDRIG